MRLEPRALCMQTSTLLVSHVPLLEFIREVFPLFQVKALNIGNRWWDEGEKRACKRTEQAKTMMLWVVSTFHFQPN